MSKIGITTTIPVEVIFAAGETPVDLNNIFITHPDPGEMVRNAEEKGLPRTLCSWVKGIFSAIIANPDIDTIIAVTEGDCTNTLAMLDLFRSKGIEVIPFAYPYNMNRDTLNENIRKLEAYFGVSRKQTLEMKTKLDGIREKALLIDRMTYEDNTISGLENHISLISLSDFEGDPDGYEKKLDLLISKAKSREPFRHATRIGFCGVPTIFSDLYGFLENNKARVVFNEMQRQFAMPYKTDNILDQYLNYTYPYSFKRRIKDTKEESQKRQLTGLIHYVQSFCHHQIHDRELRESADIPVLTLEGDKPEKLKERTRIRIESFLEMLSLGT
ncbi:MAG: 2-hydroxyacyl-CoA dehydratase [Candidatus Eremiobacteraeota bacterium]|nr:2-hydroxyacyl-CoA dehydratase [Candidatus Eremiobacteraeota bacterium]